MNTANPNWPIPADYDISLLDSDTVATLKRLWTTIEESRATCKRIEAMLPKAPVAVFDPLGLLPPAPNAPINITKQGHWPVNAMFAIEIETFHRDFENRSGGKRVRFFETEEQMNQDLVEEATHIANIDWAYSAHVQVYEWDLGPNHKRTEYLG